jgi:hypothetical protein
MKKLLLILLCLPFIGFGQLTYVPDDNFEGYLENNGMGNGISDDSVNTASIDTVPFLDVSGQSIYDLTGIEAFTDLTEFYCFENQLTSLDVSNNTALTSFDCHSNQLTTLDVSNNIALTYLDCNLNQLTSLDVSNNTALTVLGCGVNQLTSLDVSNNTALTVLGCSYNQLTSFDVINNTDLYFLNINNNNQLTSLDVRNGNNTSMPSLDTENNPNLGCINVDDPVYSSTYWTSIDPQHYFSNNCSATSIQEHTTNKELLKVADLLGRETKETNQPLFYIYDDGTVEKRIVIE